MATTTSIMSPAGSTVEKTPRTVAVLPSATQTLRTLYGRAARAFLHRDLTLTRSLLVSAFALLQPPTSPGPDALSTHRRKWDILRVTVETTFHQPQSSSKAESSQALLDRLYGRSLRLFTPSGQNLDNFALPSQIVQTLALSSIKLGCVDVGRGIIEDWLSRRVQYDKSSIEIEGYEKVLEIYCLHILPELDQWDYSQEFMQYEVELPQDRREHLRASLASLQEQHLSLPQQQVTATDASSISWIKPRPRSPDSTSSSVSTHTVVPHPRISAADTLPSSLSRTPSMTSISSVSTYRPTRRTTATKAIQRPTSLPRPPFSPQISVVVNPPPPSMYSLVKRWISPYLTLRTSKVVTLLLVFVVIPVISLLLRARRRRRLEALVVPPVNPLPISGAVRQRLQNARAEVVKAVWDTIKMGGSGLV